MLNQKDVLFSGSKLEDTDLPRIGHQIGVGEDLIHALLATETAGKSTDSKGRLKMLYEPHVAYVEAPNNVVRERLVAAGLAYPKWGTKPYPTDSYPRFWDAYKIDPTTAIKSCSWGGPQILGKNYALAGFTTPAGMVLAMAKSEEQQLQAMVNFIKNSGLDDELLSIQKKMDAGKKVTADDCVPFVRGYNGKGYAKNNYHVTFAKHVNKWVKIPDTPWKAETAVSDNIYDGKFHKEIQEVQVLLDQKKYPEVGATDGKYGSKTATAIMAFRRDNGLPLTDKIDADFLAALAIAPDRQIDPKRAEATVADLRQQKVPEIKQTDQLKNLGKVTAIVGTVVGSGDILQDFQDKSAAIKNIYDTVSPVVTFAQDNLWLVLAGVGVFLVYKSGLLQKIRLFKHQEGQDVSA